MTGQQPAPNGMGWRKPAICLALAAITFAVFGQTLRHGFVNYDDNDYVYENPLVAHGLTLQGFAWVFTHSDCSLYHPLTMLSLMVDSQLYGLHAGGYHLTSLLLHTASVILLFLVLGQMTGALWRSAFVAAVFAIHPLHVEPVAWVAERKEVLNGFFFMLTLGAYAWYVRKPESMDRSLMVAAAFVLALLSKPTAVTLPFVLLLLDYWPLNRFDQTGQVQQPKLIGIPRRLILEKIPLLALAAVACAMTFLAAGHWVALNASTSMSSRFVNAAVSYAAYLREMFWPGGLAVFYPKPANGYPIWTVVISFVLLAVITELVLRYQRQRRWLLTGWLWYLGMMTPTIGLVQMGVFAHADRYTYLPQIGIYLAVTWMVAEWCRSRRVLGGLMAGVVGVLMVCAWQQTKCWQNSEALWAHTLACTTDNYVANLNLGNSLLENGKVDEAMIHYREALRIKPRYADAHYDLGNALDQKGQTDDAMAEYEQTLQLDPGHAGAHNNLGTALCRKGRLDEGIAQFQQALQINPGFANARANLQRAMQLKQ